MKTNGVSPEWIAKALTSGRFAERLAAQRALDDQTLSFDRDATRDRLLRLLREKYSPECELLEDARELSDVRCWLLSSLGRLPADGDEPDKTLRSYLDLKKEPNSWARYWALTAILRRNPPDIRQLCEPMVNDPEVLPRMLAVAILAKAGSSECRKVIEEALVKGSKEADAKVDKIKWGALRAARFVYLPFAAKAICGYVEDPAYSDVTYDAIGALGTIPPGSSHAENAGLVLSAFITRHRRYSFWDSMRIRAIEALASLRIQSTAPLLLEELTDFNPAVASAAAVALESTLGPATTVSRSLELLAKQGGQDLPRFARGLREMRDQKAVVEELGVALVAQETVVRDYAQLLLSEIGGASAFEKLRSLTKSTERYLSILDSADEHLRELFEETVAEARTGFKIVIIMDVIVFFLGILLLGATAYLATQEDKPFTSWSTWVTGAGGVLSIVYGKFVAQPRAQVEASVQFLSGLKAVFLGYLRQLRQTDQAYTRRILDDKPLTSEETKAFNQLIEQTMEKARNHFAEKPARPKG